MIRRAFTMRLKPDSLAEYKAHHDNIWPDLVDEIERSGIASITTFQRDLDLFLVSEIEDEDAWDKLWNSEVHKRWAQVMEPLMHLRADGIVDSGELIEVFHLTTRDHGDKRVRPFPSAMAEPPSEVNMQLSYEPTSESGNAESPGVAYDAAASASETPLVAEGNGPAPAEYDAPASELLPPDEPPIAPPGEPTPAPPGKPRRKASPRRAKKKAAEKPARKKAAKAKKAKKARRPRARAATKSTRKPAKKKATKKAKAAKKATKKKAAPKKSKKTAKKKAAKKKTARRATKKRRK
jgi:L-rhamnose mutarotase